MKTNTLFSTFVKCILILTVFFCYLTILKALSTHYYNEIWPNHFKSEIIFSKSMYLLFLPLLNLLCTITVFLIIYKPLFKKAPFSWRTISIYILFLLLYLVCILPLAFQKLLLNSKLMYITLLVSNNGQTQWTFHLLLFIAHYHLVKSIICLCTK